MLGNIAALSLVASLPGAAAVARRGVAAACKTAADVTQAASTKLASWADKSKVDSMD
jgi:hypothetical protein